MVQSRLNVVIVGGGIGGLFAANALAAQGFAVAQRTEHHLRAFVGIGVELVHHDLRALEKAKTDRRFQDEDRKNKLENHSPDHGAPGKPPAIVR